MSLQTYESSVKLIPYDQKSVYNKLSDLRNLEQLKEMLSNPTAFDTVGQNLSEEQIAQAKLQLNSMQFDQDSLQFNIPPVGDICLRIVEREDPKCIKFEAEKSPFPIAIWIQIVPSDDEQCKMKMTLRTELNLMIKMMIDKHLKNGVEKIAEMLAKIPYDLQR